MKCRQARDLIGAYLYGDLAPEEMRALRVHAQDCTLCREDLASRGRIVSSLDDNAPILSEEEKQRIAWSVKGAVRRRQLETRPLAWRLLPAFGIATVLVAGIAVGRMAVMHSAHTSDSRMAKQSSGADVHVREIPPPASKPDRMLDQGFSILSPFSAPMATVWPPDRETSSGRSFKPDRAHVTPQNDGVKLAPDFGTNGTSPERLTPPTQNPDNAPKDSGPAVNKTETGTGSEGTKLPKVTDPKNAETTPSDSH